MKLFLTIMLLLLTAGFSFKGFAAGTFDASSVDSFAAQSAQESVETGSSIEQEQTAPFFLFTRALRDMAASSLSFDLGFRQVHGQPLPGVLLTLLLGAAFGLARRKRGARHTLQDEQNAADALLIVARLFRMNILFLNPPETIHAISPGPDLFCLRE